MLRNMNLLTGSAINATDGAIGELKDFYFDDKAWVVRYLVVDTGSWLLSREVLVSPYGVRQPIADDHKIDVRLTREQVKGSPNIEAHKPVSRQHELDYLDYYGYPVYWTGGGIWGMEGYPILPTLEGRGYNAPRARAEPPETNPEDSHLRSADEVCGYTVQASDGEIGHIDDFLFDDESWAIRYLIVDTRNWWPGGKKVLVAARWIDRIDWTERRIETSLTREDVKSSPEESTDYDREFEQRLRATDGHEDRWL